MAKPKTRIIGLWPKPMFPNALHQHSSSKQVPYHTAQACYRSTLRHPDSPMRMSSADGTTTSAYYVRPSGLCCRWSDGLELAASQPWRSGDQYW